MQKLRAIVCVVGMVSAVFLSPWITYVCMVALSLRFRAYEVLAMGALVDLLWLPHTTLLYSLPLSTIGAIILVWGLEPLRLEFLH